MCRLYQVHPGPWFRSIIWNLCVETAIGFGFMSYRCSSGVSTALATLLVAGCAQVWPFKNGTFRFFRRSFRWRSEWQWFLLNVCRIFFERPMFVFVVQRVAGRVLVATGWTQLAAARRFRRFRVGASDTNITRYSMHQRIKTKTNTYSCTYCVWRSWSHLF